MQLTRILERLQRLQATRICPRFLLDELLDAGELSLLCDGIVGPTHSQPPGHERRHYESTRLPYAVPPWICGVFGDEGSR